MLLGKTPRRIVAATLLTIFATQTFAPGICYALTSGPTQPEATSFEPVDTTDMVNPQTGDLTYNIPLLEVPGPDGGYPLSLSYHAGIQTNEDASWVGLGWTLNPGAIFRSVNGYPDDWYTPSTSSRTFWNGGTTTTYNVGVSVGIAQQAASVSFGLSFSQDTYRGFGAGVDVGVGFKLGKNSPFGASIGVGVDPYGNPYADGGIGYSVFKKGGLDGTVGLSFSTNFSSLEAGVNAGIGFYNGPKSDPLQGSLLGVSLSTGSSKPSLEVGGLTSSVYNGKAGNISTESHGWSFSIPVYYGINLDLGYSKTRYWSDETTSASTHGSLFPNGWGGTGNSYGGAADNAAFDEYSLLEDPSYTSIVYSPDPTKVQGGSYPDFDVYSVNAQGLGGNMRPYLLQGELLNQNIDSSGTAVVTYYSPGTTDYQPVFRFEDDFSNMYQQNTAKTFDNASLNLRLVTAPFDPNPTFGNNDGSYGYSGGNNLAGSKYVNTTIQVHPRQDLGYVKGERYFDGHMIEGYSITNESGMTYHFGLPAYSYNEENYQEQIPAPGSPSSSLVFTRDSRPSPYAYTWYLTTITGPDYVDRNGDGIADDGDWGYWVDFEYGKWSDGYVWRNPSEGYQRDQDNQYKDCSIGSREVYYLNAIRTRSHVALFEKSIRLDGKGESAEGAYAKNYDVNFTTPEDYVHAGIFDNTSEQSLQLSHIYILNASDENFVNPAASGNGYILDNGDVDAVGRANLEAKALRVIDFNYDYSLCPGTSNSFDLSNPAVKSGKLTLNSVVTRGRGGANLLPATQFSYELTGSQVVTAAGVSLSAGSFSTTNGNFVLGDMIMESGTPNLYCGVITRISQSGGTYTYTLQNGQYTGGTVTATVFTTKNPPYNMDAYDDWNMYKSDYNLTQITDNDNLGRTTSVASSRGTDAWSLHQITTGLGSKIQLNYESDNYYKSVLSSGYSFVATAIQQVSGHSDQLQITFGDVNNGMNTYFNLGDHVNALMQIRSVDPNSVLDDPWPDCGWGKLVFNDQIFDTRTSTNPTTVAAVGSNYLILQNADFSAYYQPNEPVVDINGQRIITECIKNLIPVACNLRVQNSIVSPGGGTRVKEIDVQEPLTGFTSSMAYNYNQPANPGVSSGVTSYEPWGLDIYNNLAPNTTDVNGPLAYKAALYKDINGVLAISREAPPPGVYYQDVTVTKKVQDPDEPQARNVAGSVQYEFEVFRPNMVGRVDIPGTSQYTVSPGRTSVSTGYGTMTTHNLSMMKFMDQIGQVRRIVQYDNNNKPLTETINHYLDEGLENLPLATFMPAYKARLAQYGYQGYVGERYSETKVVYEKGWNSASKVMATQSARESFPSVMMGQTVINYENGTQTSSKNLGFDFYSGAVTKTLETDAYGNNFLTQTVPAYRETGYAAMGLMSNNGSYKNMLTQTAETYMWKVDGNNNDLGLVSAGVTTWSDQTPAMGTDGSMNTQNGGSNGDVWRQQATYDWLPTTASSDGLTPTGSFIDFNFGSPSSSDTRWVRGSNITLYDVYSKALESQDVNNNYSATHLNYGENKVILTGGPANYYELAFSGAEDAALLQANNMFVKAGSGTTATGSGVAHTGAQSLLLNAGGSQGFVYTVPIVGTGTGGVLAGRTYTAAVWVKPVSGTASAVNLYYSVNGGAAVSSTVSSATSTKMANGWTLVNLTIPGTSLTSGTGASLKVWCQNDHASAQAYVDDFRFQPLNASTTAYVYDPFSGELDYTLDNSNLYTQYQYDAAGRLVDIYKEKLNVGVFKTNQYQYNYGTPKIGNQAIDDGYTKNNCPLNTGLTGSSMRVQIPANTYWSFISQGDANARASVYAQDYANMNGTCNCISSGFQWSASVTGNYVDQNIQGTTNTIDLDFTLDVAGPHIDLGQILSSCIFPTATRNVPAIDAITGATWDLIISPTGDVSMQWVSGPQQWSAGQEIILSGIYDQLTDLSYNNALSFTFYNQNCSANQTDVNGYTVNVPAYKFYGPTPQDVYNQASTWAQQQGQTAANNDVCSLVCSFNYTNTDISYQPVGPPPLSTSGSTGTFYFQFWANNDGYTGGLIGTITSCLPAYQQTVRVVDGSNSQRTWSITLNTDGTVYANIVIGPPLDAEDENCVLNGTYALQ